MALFRLSGGIRLKVELSRVKGMARVAIHDTDEKHFGHDICLSVPLEHAANIEAAVAAFNALMSTEEVDNGF